MIQLENRNTALIFLSLVVIASGCSHTGSTGDVAETTAVQIQNFSAIPDTVFESQQPTLRLSLKNVGTVDATDVEARLFNVPIGESDSREWEVDDRTFNFGRLRSADADAGIPATPKERTKTIVPPNLSSGETIPYDFMVRIFFDYKTQATTEIQLMGQDQFRDSGQSRTRPTVENTDGPIQMEIRTRTPIVSYSDGTTSSNLCLIVRNEGEGTPYNPDGDGYQPDADNEENVIKIEKRLSGSVSLESVEGSGGQVDLIGSRGIKCYKIDISDFDSASDIQRTIPITFVATYGYYKNTQTPVTVKGRAETGTESGSGDGDGSVDWDWSSSTPSSVKNNENPGDYCPRARDESPQNFEDFCVEQ